MSAVDPAQGTADFRVFLQNELGRRRKTNPSYSLRAFARFLGVEPSFLSKLINRKRPITQRTLVQFGKKMGLGPREIEFFKESQSAISELLGSERGYRTSMRFNQLTHDHFQVIADWYHYAILELLSLKSFKPERKWVARILGLTTSTVDDAVDRLVRLELMRVLPDGRWINTSGNNTTVGNDFTVGAFRKLQKNVLEMAMAALEQIPMERRDQTSMTMAINSSQLDEARKLIRKFRRDLTDLLQQDVRNRDEVYQLSISFYPVTQFGTCKSKEPR